MRGNDTSGDEPPRGFRVPAALITSRPFRAIGPRLIPRVHRVVSRLSGGRVFDTGAQPMGMLVHTGARTGARRETPMAVVPYGSHYLVVGSNFAKERHPAWSTNLLANPRAELHFRGRRLVVTARRLEGDERRDAWNHAVRWYPNWVGYARITSRELRLFELVPDRSAPAVPLHGQPPAG
ncbi:MAG: nitroreductase family deazaflavin-dependent oxidoreductase [Microthrixaceae bacterium]